MVSISDLLGTTPFLNSAGRFVAGAATDASVVELAAARIGSQVLKASMPFKIKLTVSSTIFFRLPPYLA